MQRAHGCAGAYVQDERVKNCSCIICTSAIRGGRMQRAHGDVYAAGLYSVTPGTLKRVGFNEINVLKHPSYWLYRYQGISPEA